MTFWETESYNGEDERIVGELTCNICGKQDWDTGILCHHCNWPKGWLGPELTHNEAFYHEFDSAKNVYYCSKRCWIEAGRPEIDERRGKGFEQYTRTGDMAHDR